MNCDVLIIGGGAAGLCAAVSVKRNNIGLKTAVLEAKPRVGLKLAVTGNGRCNITNRELSIKNYHGENPEFASFALKKYNVAQIEKFFDSLGVPIVYEAGGKGYPACFQASSVVDTLRFEVQRLGVEIFCDTKVTGIASERGGFAVSAGEKSFFARAVIAAGGLFSGGERLGCDGSLFNIIAKLDVPKTETFPAIVQVKTAKEIVGQLKGIKINANVSLISGGETVRKEYGEVLFCDYGLSGPPVLQVSRGVSALKTESFISLDIYPDCSFNELCERLERRAELLRDRKLEEFFTGMLQKRLGQVILKIAGCRLSDKAESLNGRQIKKIAGVLKNMSFAVTGTTGFLNSQATAGGLSTAAFDEKTMMSKKHPGLFAAGEILDIDGDCGGYNLQWAWSSAMCAADGACSFLGRKNDFIK